MNTSPCCELCKRFDDFKKNIEAGTAETYCANPSCPCHTNTYHSNVIEAGETIVKPQDWREALAEEVHKIYCALYFKDHGTPYWTEGDYSKLDERTKQYDRDIVDWHLKHRAEFVAELLAAWPEKKLTGIPDVTAGFNEGVALGRAIIESKRTTK